MSVSITDNDAAFLKEYWEIVAVKADIEVVVERLLPRDLGNGHCANLRSEAAGRFSCGIYEDRPAVCRSFEAGSDRCHEYRRMYTLEPRLDETELAAELSKIQSAPLSGKITSAYISVDSVRSAEGSGDRLGQLTVNVYVDDEDKEYELHTYHSPGETWYESDFVGLTINEARGMVNAGDRQRHRNCNDEKAGDNSIATSSDEYLVGGVNLTTGPIQITRMSKSEFCRLDEPSEAKYAKTLPPQFDLAHLSSSLADSVTGNGSSIPACQTCGVCCSHDPIVRVGLEDSRRLGSYIEITDDEEKELVVDRVVERDFLNSRCAHLSGDIGVSVQCSVYERRPDVCRHFEAGSDRCREFRRMYGLEPQLSEEEVERLSGLLQGARSGTITDAVCSVSHVKVSAQRSQTEPASFEIKRTVTVQILAAVDGDTDNWVKLHTYDPESEIWFESEFVGMTVEESLEMIESRGYQGVSN